MKKTLLLLALTSIFGTSAVCAAKVYFVNDQNWTKVRVYCAVGDKWERPIAKWPGVNMMPTDQQVNGHVVYEFEYDERKGYDRIIFNNDTVGQSPDLVLETGKVYYSLAGGWFDSPEVIPSEDALPRDTVYFVNLIRWEKVYVYAAQGENWRPQNAEWPGEIIPATGRKVMGGDVYMFSFPSGLKYDHLIFNCSECGDQTLDLGMKKGQYYLCSHLKNGTVEGKWMTESELKNSAQTKSRGKSRR